jgi:D-glycero-beta-D-manno-heptose-7-phosphate kinase
MRERWRELSEIVGRFGGAKVVVAGDLVLDRFWYGAAERISREAPVPIVKLHRTLHLPGCAANTVWNLAALGSAPKPVGIVGTESEGRMVLKLFGEMGFDCTDILREPRWETPTKTRIFAGTLHGPRQQLARIDSGEQNLFGPDLVESLKKSLRHALEGADALIFSDYGYGVVDAVFDPEVLSSVPVSAIDSRFAITRYHGLTTATPNEEEFEKACGKPAAEDDRLLEKEGERLREHMGLSALLVTRGAKGMALFEAGQAPVHLPVVGADQVVDVTGAGDTVMATYVTALCAGAGFLEAAAIANTAGGIVVQRHGPATASREEIRAALEAWGTGKL